jgi:hypothetical protein
VPDFETNRTASEAYLRMLIDRILALTPALAKRLAR